METTAEYQTWLAQQPKPTIKNNELRIGNFTSSPIYALTIGGTEPMTEAELEAYKQANPKGKRTTKDVMFGEKAKGYIAEKNMERRLGRSLNDESSARPLTWGKLVEKRVFEILPTSYKDNFDTTIKHPLIDFWAGSPDANKFDEGGTVAEIKCPLTLKSFCQFADCKTIDEVRENHADGEKYYWQIVSNAILTDSKFGELIVYLPYKSELEIIREMTFNLDGNQNKVAWIGFAEDDDLPYLPDGGYYKNLNIIRFDIPEQDKRMLTDRVIEAGKLLVPFHQTNK